MNTSLEATLAFLGDDVVVREGQGKVVGKDKVGGVLGAGNKPTREGARGFKRPDLPKGSITSFYQMGGGSRAHVMFRELRLKPASVSTLSARMGVSEGQILEVVSIPATTFTRRVREDALATDESDRVLRVARVLQESERVFGDKGKAKRWLQRPSVLLGGAVPFDLLGSDAGAQDVQSALVRIDYGDLA